MENLFEREWKIQLKLGVHGDLCIGFRDVRGLGFWGLGGLLVGFAVGVLGFRLKQELWGSGRGLRPGFAISIWGNADDVGYTCMWAIQGLGCGLLLFLYQV